MGEYTLVSKNYLTFLEGVESLFLEKFKNIVDDLNLKEMYNDVISFIENASSENIEILYDDKKALKLTYENEYQEILISCRECIEDDILKILDTSETIYSILITDRICHNGFNVHFDEHVKNIVLSRKFLGEHNYTLIKDNRIVSDSLKDFNHILWLLSIIGDYLYEFED